MALYALRYEGDGRAQTADLMARLREVGVPRSLLGIVPTLLAHCGQDRRLGDLFSNRTLTSRFAIMAKQGLRVRAP